MLRMKVNEVKGKVKDGVNRTKELIMDNKELIVYCGAAVGVVVGSVVFGRHINKKYETAWRAAKQAFDNGQLDADFGPYKVTKFFEPKTGEFIGQTMIHKTSVEAFLDLK